MSVMGESGQVVREVDSASIIFSSVGQTSQYTLSLFTPQSWVRSRMKMLSCDSYND